MFICRAGLTAVGWIALVLTLLLEQVRPLPLRNPVYALAGTVADATHDGMNAGRRRHGTYAWLLLGFYRGRLTIEKVHLIEDGLLAYMALDAGAPRPCYPPGAFHRGKHGHT